MHLDEMTKTSNSGRSCWSGSLVISWRITSRTILGGLRALESGSHGRSSLRSTTRASAWRCADERRPAGVASRGSYSDEGKMARLPGLPRTDQTHRPSRDGQRARSSLQMLDPKASGRPDRSQATAES